MPLSKSSVMKTITVVLYTKSEELVVVLYARLNIGINSKTGRVLPSPDAPFLDGIYVDQYFHSYISVTFISVQRLSPSS